MDPVTIALIVKAAIPILSPLVVALVKHFFPGTPGVVQPVLSTGVGAATDVLAGAVTDTDGSALVGGILGLAGVGVREVYDQVKRTPLLAEKKILPAVLAAVMLACSMLSACVPVPTQPGAPATSSIITPQRVRLMTMAMAVTAQAARPLSEQDRLTFIEYLHLAQAHTSASSDGPPSLASFQATLKSVMPARWYPLASLGMVILTSELDVSALAQAQGTDAVRPYLSAALEGIEWALAPEQAGGTS
jgi:hypothetical protein